MKKQRSMVSTYDCDSNGFSIGVDEYDGRSEERSGGGKRVTKVVLWVGVVPGGGGR